MLIICSGFCSNCHMKETTGDCNEVIGSTRSQNANDKDERPLCHRGTSAVILSDRSTAQREALSAPFSSDGNHLRFPSWGSRLHCAVTQAREAPLFN